MKISNVTVKNYKSIITSGKIQLENNINIFAGKNNTGKTAFIEAIYNALSGNRLDTLGKDRDKIVNVELEVTISEDELSNLYKGVQEGHIVSSIESFNLSYEYDVVLNGTCLIKVEIYHDNKFKPFYTNNTSSLEKIEYLFNSLDGGSKNLVGSTPVFLLNLYNLLSNKVIYISGSRYVPQIDGTLLSDTLSINGNNLNSFLYTLHNNNEQTFDKIKRIFTQIFNDVTSISTPIKDNNQTYISIYFEGLTDPIPLSGCGSGYTHVLLLLCVLFTKSDSIVLFDEPQVFLHPSAEKAIYDLVGDIGEHQYLFTTHSPILVNYPIKKHLFHISKEKGISVFTQLERMQEILSDIGVNNSDFALSDKVLFVEGATEELVLPKILSHFGIKQIGYNYRVLNMKGTGNEFTKKSAMVRHKEKLDLILGGVSESPIPYRIIIDSDDKTEEKLKEIKDKYTDNIIILDRREFENYLLECYKELTEVINIESGEVVTTPDEIENKIESILSNTSDTKLYPRNSTDKLINVVGSEVLERLFLDYSISYNKIIHGLHLTDLVLENQPEKLEFFKNELKIFLSGGKG